MKTYRIYPQRIVEAGSQEEALERFAAGSFDFASDAEIEEVQDWRCGRCQQDNPYWATVCQQCNRVQR